LAKKEDMKTHTRRFKDEDAQQRIPGLSRWIVKARTGRRANPVASSKRPDFLPVVLSGVPLNPDRAEQIEVILPEGTRLLVTGDKSIGLIGSILQSRL
jgi:hypothetical protein